MTAPAGHHVYSFQDYLAVEAMSTVKHEYLAGEIYAMAGGTILHAALSVAVSSGLHAQLQGRCRVLSSDLRVRVKVTGLTTYPDVSVVCGKPETDPDSDETVLNPSAVVEVLSPSTMAYDLGQKFEHYRQISSLDLVVYIWQDRRQIEVRERRADGSWATHVSGPGEQAQLPSLGAKLIVDSLYDAAE